jgi:hypothetical protein
LIARVRRIQADLGYAQRRAFEIQTGIPLLRPEQRRTRTTRPDSD